MPTNVAGSSGRVYQDEHAVTVSVAVVYTTLGYTIKQPAGSAILDAGIVVTTPFAGGTPQTMDMGVTGDLTDFASAIVLTAAGIIKADELATASKAYTATERDVVISLSAGATVSAGAGYAFVTYIMANRLA